MKIISESGQFDGLRENKDECISIRVSEFNDKKNIRLVSSNGARVIRVLVDIIPEDFNALMRYLDDVQSKNPGIELHVNVEFDKYFETAKTITNQSKMKKNSITLWPDGELKDRSYLKLDNLNCDTVIPLQYVMWHNDLENADSKLLHFFRTDVEVQDGSFPYSEESLYRDNGHVYSWGEFSNLYDLKDALVLKRVALGVLNNELSDVINTNLSDDQKILMVMKYMVDNYSYEQYPTTPNGMIRILDGSLAHKGANVLINKQGVCEGIAEAFMMLLNNPIMNIDCRCLGGLANKRRENSGHSWNTVRLYDEKEHVSRWFYMDPTWNITDNSYYRWSFLQSSDLSIRRIFDCANPKYESYDDVDLDERVMKSRMEDALSRIERTKNGEHLIRIHYSLEDIVNSARGKQI